VLQAAATTAEATAGLSGHLCRLDTIAWVQQNFIMQQYALGMGS
jgi:hypothetical protein